MKKIVYRVMEEKYEQDGKIRISYGIAVTAHPDEDGAETALTSLHDIGSDREKLMELVDSCNRLELSAAHLLDVVEDYLST